MSRLLFYLFVFFLFSRALPMPAQALPEELIHNHDYGQALRQLGHMIASPRDSIHLLEAYMLLAQTALSLKKYDEALRAIDKALEWPLLDSGRRHHLQLQAAQVYLDLSAPDAAKRFARAVWTHARDTAMQINALQLLSKAEASLQQYDSAWYHLQRASQWQAQPSSVPRAVPSSLPPIALLIFACVGWVGWLFHFLKTSRKAENVPDKNGTPQLTMDIQQQHLECRQQLQRLRDVEMEQVKTRLLSPQRDEDVYWKDFLLFFARIHPDFFQQLKSSYPDVSPHELRLCALIKLNLSNQEIAKALHITMDSVRKARYRVYKKMGLDSDLMFSDFLIQL
jgi:DNA-binding CsgD family transcriptional regulator